MAKDIKEIELKNQEKVITEETYNEDRTMAFTMTKVQHRKDSIAWVIGGSLLLVFLIMSLGRLTIIGEFFDDVIFNFLFGWFKWVVYLGLFWLDASIFFGLKFRFKKMVILMSVLTTLTLSWLITTGLMMDYWRTGALATTANAPFQDVTTVTGWDANCFVNTNKIYINDWYENSIFGTQWAGDPNTKYGIWAGGYASSKQGGGIFGAVLAGAFGYTSLPFSFILGTFFFFLEIVWILTGNPFFLFLPKNKRKGKKVRLLAMHYKDNPYSKDTVKTKDLNKQEKLDSKKSRWDEVNAFDDNDYKAIDDKDHSPRGSKRRPELLDYTTFNFDDEDNLKSYSVKDSKGNKLSAPVSTDTFVRADDTLDTNADVSSFAEADEPSIDDTSFFDDVMFGDEKKPEPAKAEEPKKEKKKFKLFGKKEDKEESVPTADKAEEKVIEKEAVDYSSYKLPSLDLLTDIEPDESKLEANKVDTENKKQAIDNVFQQFNVGAHVVNYIIGPTVTKFEIEPEAGTKVNSISGLEQDLKLALGVQSMRIEAPIKGKNLVGIEIQNTAGSIVNLKDMLEEMPTDMKSNPLSFVLGQDVLGKPLFANLAKFPHLLVAGSTGSGKSVMINTLIMSLIMRNTPEQVKFIMVDPKQVELSIYSELPFMMAPVISDPLQAQNVLKKVADLMEDRYTLFKDARAKNIEGYNYNRKKGRLPYLVVIVDELADLMVTGDKKQIEDSISRITAKARAAGIHLVLATQRPSVDVITGVIKSNIPSRIAFAVSSGTDSRTILDSLGAEALVGHGDMLFTPPGSSDLVRAQGAYVSDQDIEKVVDEIDAKFKPDYLWTEDDLKASAASAGQEKDEYFEAAKEWVKSLDTVSISQIQRKYSVSYNRAGRIADELAEEGIISAANGAKPRKVFSNRKDN